MIFSQGHPELNGTVVTFDFKQGGGPVSITGYGAMLAALKVLVKPFLREHQDATAKIRRQWAYVLKERDGTIEKYAFFYINTVFNLTNCVTIVLRS